MNPTRFCLVAGFAAGIVLVLAFAPFVVAQTAAGPGPAAGGAGLGNSGTAGGTTGQNVPPPANNNGGASVPATVVVGVVSGTVTAPTPTIVAPRGALVGDTVSASAVLTSTLATAATRVTTQAPATYQWSISGGRIISDPKAATIDFVADGPGTVTLSAVLVIDGSPYAVSAEVTILSADAAGEITVPHTIAAGSTGLTASVPPAQNGDRTFRWTITGGVITDGQATSNVMFRAGNAGLCELICNVSLQNLITVPVHAFALVTGNGAPVSVTVNGGSGGGSWPGGSRVDVFANPPPAGQVFDQWTGDTSALGTGTIVTSIAHGVVTVPANPIALTATYKPAPTWTPTTVANFNPQTQATANNQTVTITTTLAYYIPAGAQGVVFLLHDSGSSATEWFTRPEQVMLTRDLVAAGYGVAALNSFNRNVGTWAAAAALASNLDALNHAAALDKFVRDGVLAATKPVFFLGMADGGDAAARFAEMLATATPARPVKGTALYLAAGTESLSVTSKVPQFFALASNDDGLGANGIATARANSQLMAGRGLTTGSTTNFPSPLTAGRLLALGVNTPSFTANDATAIYTALKAANLVDVNGYPKSLPASTVISAALPAAYRTRTADVAAELGIAYAATQFYSDANARVVAFFNNCIANTPAPPPGRLVNLSTRSVISFVGDTLALGFNVSGPDKATLLVRGIGPALAGFGLSTAITRLHLDINAAGNGTPIVSNEGWDKAGNGGAQIAAAAASVGAFALSAGSADTAVLLQVGAGTYTINLNGINGTTGDVLAEVYDVSRNNTRLTNLSVLGKITDDGSPLIAGLAVSGNNPRTLMVRAVGPGLAVFGLSTSDLLGDPRITVLNGLTTVATNNNWIQGGAGTTAALVAAFPAVGAFPLTNGSSDAALVTALAPAAYTLQTSAAPVVINPNLQQPAVAPNAIGKVLVEVYEVP